MKKINLYVHSSSKNVNEKVFYIACLEYRSQHIDFHGAKVGGNFYDGLLLALGLGLSKLTEKCSVNVLSNNTSFLKSVERMKQAEISSHASEARKEALNEIIKHIKNVDSFSISYVNDSDQRFKNVAERIRCYEKN